MGQKSINKKIPGSDKCYRGPNFRWVVKKGLSEEVIFKLKQETHKGGGYVYNCT